LPEVPVTVTVYLWLFGAGVLTPPHAGMNPIAPKRMINSITAEARRRFAGTATIKPTNPIPANGSHVA